MVALFMAAVDMIKMLKAFLENVLSRINRASACEKAKYEQRF